jgi:hypothetical protein
MNEEIEITAREALICEQAIEALEGRPHAWPQFASHMKAFCGGIPVTDKEVETLKAKLRGEK